MIRLTGLWNINTWIVTKSLEGFTGDDWRKRPEGSNPAIWLLGHLVYERKRLLGELGAPVEIEERDRRFAGGTKPEDVPADLDPGDLVTEFQALHEQLVDRLEGMEDADLEQPIESEFPEMPKTRLGAVHFLNLHETYHVGQLGALRVMLGKGSWMAG